MRRPFIAGLAAATALMTTLGWVATAAAVAPAAETKTITIADFQYDPKEITVQAGDTVVWTNTGKAEHTVVRR